MERPNRESGEAIGQAGKNGSTKASGIEKEGESRGKGLPGKRSGMQAGSKGGTQGKNGTQGRSGMQGGSGGGTQGGSRDGKQGGSGGGARVRTWALVAFGVLVVAAAVAMLARSIPDGTETLDPRTQAHAPHVFGYAPDGETVWLGTHTGFYAFAEDGRWERTVEPLADRDVMGYQVNGNDPETLYVSGHGFVIRSTDGGATWAPIENGMPNAPKPDVPDAHLMTQSPSDPLHLYVFLAQERNNVYETTDGGETWRLAGTITPFAFSIAPSPSGNGVLAASRESGVVEYTFRDGKTTAETVWSPDPSGHVATLADGTVVALFGDGFRKTTDGKTWAAMNVDHGGEFPLGLRASHEDPNRLAVVTIDYSLYESLDGGKTWEKRT